MALASTATLADDGLVTRRRMVGTSVPSLSLPLSSPRRLVRFAAVGGSGTLVNLAVLASLLQVGVHYLPAAIIAAELSILSNFGLQERFVFADRREGRGWWSRLGRTAAYNNADMLARLPLLALLVEAAALHAVPAQALTLGVAFLLRFLFLSRVVYRPVVAGEVR